MIKEEDTATAPLLHKNLSNHVTWRPSRTEKYSHFPWWTLDEWVSVILSIYFFILFINLVFIRHYLTILFEYIAVHAMQFAWRYKSACLERLPQTSLQVYQGIIFHSTVLDLCVLLVKTTFPNLNLCHFQLHSHIFDFQCRLVECRRNIVCKLWKIGQKQKHTLGISVSWLSINSFLFAIFRINRLCLAPVGFAVTKII